MPKRLFFPIGGLGIQAQKVGSFSSQFPEKGKKHLEKLNWGLVPFWAKDTSIGNKMINARSETAASKLAFRTTFKRLFWNS
jgi:putative SOS response-associated peptidase YedK